MTDKELAREAIEIITQKVRLEAIERRMNAERRIQHKRHMKEMEAIAAEMSNEMKLDRIIQKFGFESLKTITFARAIETGRKDINYMYVNLMLNY